MTTTTQTLSAQCDALRELKQERDEAKAVYDDLKTQHEIAELALIERMELEDADGHKTGGTNFIPVETPYAQVQDRESFVEWAKLHDEALIEEKERKGNLNELVRERLDNGEGMPPGIGFYVKKYISQRAS
jgi:hypothetical protein